MLLTVISLETEYSFFHMLMTETATFREKAQDKDVYENCHTKTIFFFWRKNSLFVCDNSSLLSG